MSDADLRKREAAARALEFVEDGMRLGLGTGSTARHFVDLLGARVRDGMKVVGVPTSETTRAQAASLGIPLIALDDGRGLDLAVDGADEIDRILDVIKGGGGALLREKIVAAAARRMIVIADGSKQVKSLGRFPLPIEIVAFETGAIRHAIEHTLRSEGFHAETVLRPGADGHAFVTDGGHQIVDVALQRIDDPQALSRKLNAIPGVVEHGLFLDMVSCAIIAGDTGITVVERRDCATRQDCATHQDSATRQDNATAETARTDRAARAEES